MVFFTTETLFGIFRQLIFKNLYDLHELHLTFLCYNSSIRFHKCILSVRCNSRCIFNIILLNFIFVWNRLIKFCYMTWRIKFNKAYLLTSLSNRYCRITILIRLKNWNCRIYFSFFSFDNILWKARYILEMDTIFFSTYCAHEKLWMVKWTYFVKINIAIQLC